MSEVLETIGSYMAYISPLLAFGIAFAGVIGDTRIAQGTGLQSIRPAGWIIISLAALTLFGSFYSTYQKNMELEEIYANQRMQEKMLLTKCVDLLAKLSMDCRQFTGNSVQVLPTVDWRI